MLTIYLIRHAEAEGNVTRRAHGRYDSYLTKNGEEQLSHLASRFSGVKLDAVYSSDLRRAMQTAYAVIGNRPLSPTPEAALREMYYGDWEDRCWGEIAMLYPVEYAVWRKRAFRFTAPGGEGAFDVGNRILQSLLSIARHEARKGDDRTVAVSSHGTAILAFSLFARKLPFEELDRIVWPYNTAVMKLSYTDGEGLHLLYENDVSHLPLRLNSYTAKGWWANSDEKNVYFIPVRTPEERAEAEQMAGRALAGDVAFAYRGRLEGFARPEDRVGLVSTLPGEGVLDLEYCYLIPACRGSGTGGILIGEAVSRARRAGLYKLRVKSEASAVQFSRRFLEAWDFTSRRNQDTIVFERDAGLSPLLL